MAKAVYNEQVIQLQDDETVVALRPLPIGRLRRFLKAWEKIVDAKNEDDAYLVYLNCCGIAIEKQIANKFSNTFSEDGVINDNFLQWLEDVLDLDTIYVILEVAGGLKLNDPKLMEAAQAALSQANQE